MRGGIEACIARIAARGTIGQAEARDLLIELEQRADEMRRSGADDPVVTAAGRMAEGLKEKARKDRLDALNNAAIRNGILDRIRDEGGLRELAGSERTLGITLGLTGLRGGTKAAQVMRSLMHYVPGASFFDSAEGRGHALARQWISQAVIGLRKAEVETQAVAGTEDRGVAEALWRLNGGDPRDDVTISPTAQKIAGALHPPAELSRLRMNDAGARIGNAIDYVTKTNWDSRQLRLAAGKGAEREAAYQAWRADDVPRMHDKTFEDVIAREDESDVEARERMIRSIYDATESGVHKSFIGDDAPTFTPPAFEGTYNIARAASHQRVVYWKDSQAWYDHQMQFGGGGTVYRQMTESLNSAARQTALMKIWGTNPRAALNMMIDRIAKEYRESDNLEKFQAETASLRTTMEYLDGTANIPVNEDWARRLDYFNTLQAAAHLGGVSLTHVAAAPGTFGSEMAHHGESRLSTSGRVLSALLTTRGPLERQEILADAGAYAHGALLNIAANREVGSGLPGWVTARTAQFMRLTGLPRVLERIQTEAAKSVLMTRLGRAAGAAFDRLIPEQAEILRHYGINEPEWDLLRSAAPVEFEGQRYMTPRDAQNIDNGRVVGELLRRGTITDTTAPALVDRAVQRFKWDLGDRYLMYLNDAAEHGAVTPGVRERALMIRGARPGSPFWLAARLFSQFKMWPVAAVNQIMNREIASAGRLTPGAVAWNVGSLIALATAGGALRMSINDLAAGSPQRNYMHPVTLLAALAQGGGLGIYGDFLFGETSRLGAGLGSTLMGPAGADFDRLLRIRGRFVDDIKNDPGKALQHMWPDLAHLAVGHIPYANLIYLKGALDYLLWYHLYEAASPGWWQRTNARLEKERGRTMMGFHPGSPVPFAPWQ